MRSTLRIAKAQLYKNVIGVNPYEGVGDDPDKRALAEEKVEDFYQLAAHTEKYEKPDGTWIPFDPRKFTVPGKGGVELPGIDALKLFNQALNIPAEPPAPART